MLANILTILAAPVPDSCKSTFFGFPVWYKYLESANDPSNACAVQFSSLADIWLVVAAVIEMLLRLGALVAMLFVLIGGIKFIMSQGDTGGGGAPNKVAIARQTAINGLIGLVITVAATAVVSYIAGKFS